MSELQLYSIIERAFEKVLPILESVWSYSNTVELYDLDESFENYYQQRRLRCKSLQVITKIVKITLNSGNDLIGAWHVEGMSHENIVATVSITLEQNDGFNAELSLKRGYTTVEAECLRDGLGQDPSNSVERFLNTTHVPLGKVVMNEGMIVSFPNSHIHRIDMKNSGNQEHASRTILVFWLVNPDVRIISTKNIAQQCHDMTRACENRLLLMKERTFHKQTFNRRDLNLCEH